MVAFKLAFVAHMKALDISIKLIFSFSLKTLSYISQFTLHHRISFN